MKHAMKTLMLVGVMLFANYASAMPLPDFILYGATGGKSSVSAYWNDERIAVAEMIDGYFKLVIPMDTTSAWKSGDVIELWVNGEPTGRTTVIGKMGEARRLAF